MTAKIECEGRRGREVGDTEPEPFCLLTQHQNVAKSANCKQWRRDKLIPQRTFTALRDKSAY